MSELNTFSKKSDTKTIIRFVKEIERHPCLYDQNSMCYIDRELKKKTWNSIAKKANTTVAECKDKWTKIRTAYIRTLRPSYNDGIRTFGRPYYLASHLKFITPMKRKGAKNCINCPSTSENIPETEENNDIDASEEDGNSNESDNDSLSLEDNSQHEVFLEENKNSSDDNDDDIMGYDNLVIDKQDTTCQAEMNKAAKTKVQATNTNELKRRKIEKHNSCNENIEYNPRKMFVFSLLPDIEDLNEQQMRYFRREVIKLIDNVMTD